MSDHHPRKRDPLTELTEREKAAYLRRSSMRFLECAIHLCATHMPIDEVAQVLEAEAEQLRRYS
ncbi:hypothetical protein PYH37_002298 [Sinorhizobium numidicum]|uniref:Uncharacterized protein n=1 Tax=Sinorhizobium numidicum TaxID=680248 RepID=A0ABY8D1A7_9HYPH|nr:hypothetical protein [Sinorhizobium numidicum]WEX77497.1 hypothetical protein PYH37_002298 [Sinorhizobium numidicum]WEX84157.1 hypothetical protein PYH38_003011 [Sinorhizobium numidicum]